MSRDENLDRDYQTPFGDCKENSSKTCFIITPIGEPDSDVRKVTDSLIKGIIAPALEKIGFNKENIRPAHEIYEAGNITSQIVRELLTADLVIANLTGNNPNVYYEVAIRHYSKLPMILMSQNGEKPAFDITTHRVIPFTTDMSKVSEYWDNLIKAVLSAKSKNEDNLFIQGIKEARVSEELPKSEGVNLSSDLIDVFLSYFNTFTTKLNDIETILQRVSPDKNQRNVQSFIRYIKEQEDDMPFSVRVSTKGERETTENELSVLREIFNYMVSYYNGIRGPIVFTGSDKKGNCYTFNFKAPVNTKFEETRDKIKELLQGTDLVVTD